MVKNPPAMQEMLEMQVQSLSWEDSLEEEMATYSSILAWEITWIESGGLQPMRSQESISTTLPKSIGSSKSKRVPEKSIYFCFIDYTKAFDCVDHNKLWKIVKRWEYQTT